VSIPDLLAEALRRDPARPLLTFYDHATGERVELSTATTANWVAKTANMLQDSLAAASGTTVSIDLPVHWERAVWMLAAWEVGCVVLPGPAGEQTCDIAVVGPDALDGDLPDADEIVALSLRPLGARFASELPAGVVDYNAEVLGHGDHFTPYDRPGAETKALVVDGNERDHGACVEAARRRAAGWQQPQPRVLTGGTAGVEDAVEILLAALAADGSVVLAANPRADRLASLRADEQINVVDALDG